MEDTKCQNLLSRCKASAVVSTEVHAKQVMIGGFASTRAVGAVLIQTPTHDQRVSGRACAGESADEVESDGEGKGEDERGEGTEGVE